MSSTRRGFHVLLYRQIRWAPWWVLSLFVHGILISLFFETALATLAAPSATGVIALRTENPPASGLLPEISPDLVDLRPVEGEEVMVAGPMVRDALGDRDVEAAILLPFEESLAAEGLLSDAPFEGPSTNAAIGIGGGAGGSFGGRGGARNELLVVEQADGPEGPAEFRGREITEGMLLAFDDAGADLGACPLRHTDVRAEVTAFLASVDVTQRFQNDLDEKVEAIYVFPLPVRAAVNDFLMTVGDRTIRGVIREREEARRIYEEAKRRGQVVSLLTQERPNLFTQKVANLEPGKRVDVSIRYFHPLRMRDGWHELVFPTVVGPRYIPGRPVSDHGPDGGGWSADTDRVPDASRITPPVARPGTRAGHDVSIAVSIDAGVRIEEIECPTHEIVTERPSDSRAEVALATRATIPNRDFVLRYRVGGAAPQTALLAHRGPLGGFFALVLAPPAMLEVDRVPREMVFVLDCSGSMRGDPLEKSKAVVRRCLSTMRPTDTFRVIRFSATADELSVGALPATSGNVDRALAWLGGLSSAGGTEMITGIRAALAPAVERGRVRYVCFLTDGFIGNETEIFGAVRELRKAARLFSFGVGSSVNRHLLDGLAEEGHGAVQYVLAATSADDAAEEFRRRLESPAFADLTADFGGIPVRDLHPSVLPDLYPGLPVMVVGRYEGGGETTVTIRGFAGSRAIRWQIPVTFPEWEERNEVLGPAWARQRIHELMRADLSGITAGTRKKITDLAIDFRLLSAFTSFVAVDSDRITDDGPGIVVTVPVDLPAGVAYSGVFGDRGDWFELKVLGLVMTATPSGLVVTDVRDESPAAEAGIEPGDLVRTLNDVLVRTGLEAAAAARQADDEIRCELRREGERRLAVFRRK